MKTYTICNEYVDLITNEGIVRCEIKGNNTNRYIIVGGMAYLVSELR